MKNNIITTSKKSKRILLIAGIVAIGLIFLSLIYFMYLSNRYGINMNYILYHIIHEIIDEFDDIVETLFKLSITVAVIVFLIVFFKKIWHKL